MGPQLLQLHDRCLSLFAFRLRKIYVHVCRYFATVFVRARQGTLRMKDKGPLLPNQPQSGAIDGLVLVRKLYEEIFRQRQIIDEMANTIAELKELNQQLKDEIARLKGQKPRPKIPPSTLEGPYSKSKGRKYVCQNDRSERTILLSTLVKNLTHMSHCPLRTCFSIISADCTLQKFVLKIARLAKSKLKTRVSKPGQPNGKPRRKKTTVLPIHESPIIEPENIPKGSKFKGFCRYTVQEIILHPHNIQYRLARWQMPDGKYITGELPKDVRGHYGSQLVAYILHQYHGCRVTEGVLLDHLRSVGILMSAGQLNNILLQGKNAFIEEVAELLPVAAKMDGQIQVDDTGGRHKGQNQYTTIIGNRWFSVFSTTDSKSRVNFLKQLQGGKEEFVINGDAIEYLSHVESSGYLSGYMALFSGNIFTTHAAWEQFLQERNIACDTERRFVSEAALYASVIHNGIPRDLGVHSDDAGQFDVFVHSLCWVHQERHYRKLIMTTDASRLEQESVMEQIWILYQSLKSYKENPSDEDAAQIEKRFDKIFQQKTSSPTLNRQLEKTHAKKDELLRVLERPQTPLHNNSSETCARAAKIKFKISGGTRSELGRAVRDAFLSLKQTCRKLGVNFAAFLQDRVHGWYDIPRLGTIIRELTLAAGKDPPQFLLYPSSQVCLQRLVG